MFRSLKYAALVALVCAIAVPMALMAQSVWNGGVVVGSSGVPVGSSSTLIASLTAPADTTAIVEFLLTDAKGNVAVVAQENAVFKAGQSTNVSYVYTPTVTSLNGTYNIGVAVFDSTASTQLFASGTVATLTVVGGSDTVVPPSIFTPPPASGPPVSSAPPSSSPPSSAPNPAVRVPPCYPSKVKLLGAAIGAPAIIGGTFTADVDGNTIPSSSTRYDRWSIWVCDMGNGYLTNGSMYASSSNVIDFAWNYLFGSWSATQARSDCAASCSVATVAEDTFLQQFLQKYRPKAFVRVNGKLPTRDVYVKKPDGVTRNTTPVGLKVPVGIRCNEADRIANTDFYSVMGAADINGVALPHVYTDCGGVVFPLTPNPAN